MEVTIKDNILGVIQFQVGLFIQINKHTGFGLDIPTPDREQIITEPKKASTEVIVQKKISGATGQNQAENRSKERLMANPLQG